MELENASESTRALARVARSEHLCHAAQRPPRHACTANDIRYPEMPAKMKEQAPGSVLVEQVGKWKRRRFFLLLFVIHRDMIQY
jgi:hypothetical protein